MSIRSGFFDSMNGDRKYNAEEFASIFDGIIKDGIIQDYGGHMAVTAQSGFTVRVATGRAWFNHTWTLIDNPYDVTITSPSSIYNRIDTVVLEVNKSSGVRGNTIKVFQGTQSSNPRRATLTNNENIYLYPLAYITVRHGATSISNSDIESAIGTSSTPFVTAPLQSVGNTETLKRWESMFNNKLNSFQEDYNRNIQSYINGTSGTFNTWFNNIKKVLGNNPTSGLTEKITNVESRISSVESSTNSSISSINSRIDSVSSSADYAKNKVNDLKDNDFFSSYDFDNDIFESLGKIPVMHRNIYRGKNLGSYITSEQLNQIESGIFKNLWIGDYWQHSGYTWKIIDIDYFYGNTIWNQDPEVSRVYDAVSKHHIVVMCTSNSFNNKYHSFNWNSGAAWKFRYTDIYNYITNTSGEFLTAVYNTFSNNYMSFPVQEINGQDSNNGNVTSVVTRPIKAWIPTVQQYLGVYPYQDSDKGWVGDLRQFALFERNPQDNPAISQNWLLPTPRFNAHVCTLRCGVSQSSDANTIMNSTPFVCIGR